MNNPIQRYERRGAGHSFGQHVGRGFSDAYIFEEESTAALENGRVFLFSVLLYGLAYLGHLLFRFGWTPTSDHLHP